MALAEALHVNGSLTHLDLNNCDLSSESAVAIAVMLKVNTALEQVDLGENEFSDASLHLLAEAISINRSLHTIALPKDAIPAHAELLKQVLLNDVVIKCTQGWYDKLGSQRREFWHSVRKDCVLYIQLVEGKFLDCAGDAWRFVRALFRARRQD